MILNIFYLLIYFLFHPVHVSVSNVDYSEKNKSFEISIKIFVNDLEQIINSKYNVKVNLGKADENRNSADLINQYITENYSIIINNKTKLKNKLIFKEKKIIEDSIWLYYEYKGVKKNVKTLTIKNSILTDLYKDQNNLLIINYFDFQKGYNLKYKDDSVKIDL